MVELGEFMVSYTRRVSPQAARTGSSVAAAGTTTPTIAGPRTGTTTVLVTRTTTSGSGLSWPQLSAVLAEAG